MMQQRLSAIVRFLNGLSERVGRITAWLTLFMVLVTFAVVVLRYVFDLGWIGMQESIVYMHATVFMLGAAYTLNRDGHVRVDVLYQSFNTRKKALVDLLGGLLLLVPVTIYIIWASWDYVAESWGLLEASPETGGLPLVFVLKTLIPLMGILMLLQAVSGIIQNGLVLAGFSIENETDVEGGGA